MQNYGFVKCGIANFNCELSNPKSALQKIKEMLIKADSENVKLLVFPELSLTGYTCQDLFLFSELLDSAMEALKELVEFSKNYNIVFVVGSPIKYLDSLYNCAITVFQGKIYGIVPKQYIPNYGEFYEKRWFSTFQNDEPININLFGEEIPFGNLIFSSNIGFKLGIEICEDLWSVIPPSSYLSLAGANIIANLSSSNELVRKR